MAQSFIGGASGTTSATIPAHQVGDLIIARAFRDGNNTAPTIPAGVNWTTIDNSAGSNSNGAAIAYKFATSTGETTGTWTSATRLDVGVWRGFSTCAAHFSVDGAAGTTVNYKTVASFASGSWAIAFGAHRSVNTTLETPPTGMTNRYSDVNGTDEGAIHDTNGTVSSWSDTSVSVGGTSSGWRSHVIEAVPGATNTTLTAGVGSYSLTGTAATLHYGRTIPAGVGSYTISGTAAVLHYGRKIVAGGGTYSITGVAATLLKASTLAAAVGSYVISGVAAGLSIGRKLSAAVGSYLYTGVDATLTATSTAPPAETPTFTGDIGPGDYTTVPKEFETRQALKPKRRRLPKSVVNQATKIAVTEPTLDQVMSLARAVMPKDGEVAATDLGMSIMAAIQDNIAREAMAKMESAAAAAFRKRLIIERIAHFLDVLEQDEILFTYLA